MSTSRDDERLLDDLFAEAREEPRPEDIERLQQRLEPWLGPAAEGASAVKPAVRSTRALRALVAIVGVGLVVHVFRQGASTDAVEPPPTSAPAVQVPARAAEPSIAVTALPEARPASPIAKVDPAVASNAPPAVAPSTRSTAASNAHPTVSAVAARPRPAPGVTASEAKPVAQQELSESEASFLRRTRAALADDPARALRMTGEHAALYPRGVLEQEREVIAIEALVRLGAREEARLRASAFRARYPSSAHASRIAAIVGPEEP